MVFCFGLSSSTVNVRTSGIQGGKRCKDRKTENRGSRADIPTIKYREARSTGLNGLATYIRYIPTESNPLAALIVSSGEKKFMNPLLARRTPNCHSHRLPLISVNHKSYAPPVRPGQHSPTRYLLHCPKLQPDYFLARGRHIEDCKADKSTSSLEVPSEVEASNRSPVRSARWHPPRSLVPSGNHDGQNPQPRRHGKQPTSTVDA